MAGEGIFQDVLRIVSAEDLAQRVQARQGRERARCGRRGCILPGCSASGIAAIIWALHLAGMCRELRGAGTSDAVIVPRDRMSRTM